MAPGAGDISSCHLSLRNHSLFLISMATGEPSVRPWRTPPSNVELVLLELWRGPRPYPRRRRASSAWISSTVIGSPAGSPSTITTRAWPWDSPAVRYRSIRSRLLAPRCQLPLCCRPHHRGLGARRRSTALLAESPDERACRDRRPSAHPCRAPRQARLFAAGGTRGRRRSVVMQQRGVAWQFRRCPSRRRGVDDDVAVAGRIR